MWLRGGRGDHPAPGRADSTAPTARPPGPAGKGMPRPLLLALLAPVAAVADCAGLEPVTPQVSVETGEPAEPRIEPASAEEIRSRAARTGTMQAGR